MTPTPIKPAIQIAPSTSAPSPALPPRASPLYSVPERPLKRKSLTPSTPTLSTGDNLSPREAVEAFTPVDSAVFTDLAENSLFANHTSKTSSVESKEALGLDGSHEPHKKPRLVSLDFDATLDDTKPSLEENNDLEESDDEADELDDQGLRLPKSCVAIIMEEDENTPGVLSCQSCRRVHFIILPFYISSRINSIDEQCPICRRTHARGSEAFCERHPRRADTALCGRTSCGLGPSAQECRLIGWLKRLVGITSAEVYNCTLVIFISRIVRPGTIFFDGIEPLMWDA